MQTNDLFFGYGEFESERPFDFSKHSSVGCGGCARIAFYPHSEEEVRALVSRLKSDGNDYITLGNLTNVLPSDEGVKKAVVSTKKLTRIELSEEENAVYAEAGASSGALLRVLKKAGMSGAEFLIGIPCTLGGALYMNAGAGGKYISEIVESVRVYRAGEILTLSAADCKYSYKNSVFMQTEDIILGGTLRLEKSDEKTVAAREKYWLNKRAHLPKGKSMGCTFKNPDGVGAGELIDRTGLKGLRVGGARVSEEHANFIINDRKATARQIKTLIGIIKNAVFAQYGVTLQEEIRYLE